MIKQLLTGIIVCSTMFLTACDDGNVTAKDLVRWDCKFTGKSFINEYEICTQTGRICGGWETRTELIYVYECPNKNDKVLSTHKLVFDKVE